MKNHGHNKIPTEDDFARAEEAAEAQRNRGLDAVRQQVLSEFGCRGIHEVFPFFSPRTETFVVHVFCRQDDQLAEFKDPVFLNEMRSIILNELENAGRGDRQSLKINIEIDSHENVVKNYDGDYYSRLR